MIKYLVAICLALFGLNAAAQTCPTVNEIKSQSLTDWKAYDSDDGAPLSSKRVAEIKKYIDQFAMAEFTGDSKKTGAIHCYYRDSNGSSLEAYFSKNNFVPENNKNYWYAVSGSMNCAAGFDKCQFKNAVAKNEIQVAAK